MFVFHLSTSSVYIQLLLAYSFQYLPCTIYISLYLYSQFIGRGKFNLISEFLYKKYLYLFTVDITTKIKYMNLNTQSIPVKCGIKTYICHSIINFLIKQCFYGINTCVRYQVIRCIYVCCRKTYYTTLFKTINNPAFN